MSAEGRLRKKEIDGDRGPLGEGDFGLVVVDKHERGSDGDGDGDCDDEGGGSGEREIRDRQRQVWEQGY